MDFDKLAVPDLSKIASVVGNDFFCCLDGRNIGADLQRAGVGTAELDFNGNAVLSCYFVQSLELQIRETSKPAIKKIARRFFPFLWLGIGKVFPYDVFIA